MIRNILGTIFLTMSVLIVGISSSYAAGSYDEAVAEDPLKSVKAMINIQDYNGAISELKVYTANNPQDADGFNLLGFASRKNGDLESAGVAYNKALELEPNHKGALEYQGELFLQLNDLASAEANEVKLSAACFFGCSELSELREAIAQYKATN